jgi:hypothetical protein
MERHSSQGYSFLLAHSEEHIHLTLIGMRIERFSAANQLIRHAGARRNDDHDLVTRIIGFLDSLRDVLDPIDISDRSAAVFLNDKGHLLKAEIRKIKKIDKG